MAYVFQNINNLLNPEDDKTSSNTNIFAPGESQNAQTQNGTAGSAPQLKTSTETDMGSTAPQNAGSAATSAPKPQAQPQRATAAATGNMLGKNARTQLNAVGNIQKNLNNIETNTQKEADAYMQRYNPQQYGVSNQDIDRAIQGDNDAINRTKQVMDKTRTVKADDFNTTFDPTVQGLADLGTQEGLKNLLRKEQNEQYTSGEGAFDAMLLGRDQAFQDTRRALENKQRNIYDLIGQQTGTAQKGIDDAVVAARDAATGYVQGKQQGLNDRQAKEMALYNKKIQDVMADQTYGTTKADQAFKEFTKQHGKTSVKSHDASQYFDEERAKQDLTKYLRYADVATDQNQFIDQSEATQLNNIASLLGSGDIYRAGDLDAHVRAQDLKSFDTKAYQDAILGAATARDKADNVKAQKTIDDILKIASGRSKQDSRALDAARHDAALRVENALASTYGDVYSDQAVNDFLANQMAFNQFFTQVNPLAGLTQDEVIKLNAAQRELGQKEIYKYDEKGRGLESGFDSAAYKAALKDLFAGMRQSNADAAAAAAAEAERKDAAQRRLRGAIVSGATSEAPGQADRGIAHVSNKDEKLKQQTGVGFLPENSEEYGKPITEPVKEWTPITGKNWKKF